jgi:hypothetical protein
LDLGGTGAGAGWNWLELGETWAGLRNVINLRNLKRLKNLNIFAIPGHQNVTLMLFRTFPKTF